MNKITYGLIYRGVPIQGVLLNSKSLISSDIALDNPKSAILITFSEFSKTFDGFRSLWITLLSYRYRQPKFWINKN